MSETTGDTRRLELDQCADPSPREGLPSTFRMRHDAHYVEELTALSARHVSRVHDPDSAPVEGRGHMSRPVDAQKPAVPVLLPCFSAAVAAELAESLEAASACLTLNTGQTRGTFTGRVAKELLGIELQRASRAARAAAVVSSPPALAPRDLLLSALVHDVVAATDSARRMAGARIDVAIADRDSWMRADGDLLTLALAGTLDAMLGVVTAPAMMRIAVKGTAASPSLTVELSVSPVAPPAAPARFFDARDAAHPWGPWAALLLAAAAQVAQAHGGYADVKSLAPGECTIVLALPRR